MAVALGKRKRRSEPLAATAAPLPRASQPSAARERASSDGSDERARQLFQRAFEAKFRPLERNSASAGETEISSSGSDLEETDDQDNSLDWSGLSDDDQEDDDDDNDDNDYNDDDGHNGGPSPVNEVEIVEFSGRAPEASTVEVRRRKKGFMSSKPPSSSDEPPTLRPSAHGLPNANAAASSSAVDDDNGSEASNLKNDLALQRLLKEAHLLDPTAFARSSLEPQGAARLRAQDLRLRDLGAKQSALAQQRMPMAHRKGIVAKAAAREATRRREAAENGIVLERKARKGSLLAAAAAAAAGNGAGAAAAGASSARKKRLRGVGAPAVGRFKGGTLSLSARDVRSIQGQGERGSGKMGRRR